MRYGFSATAKRNLFEEFKALGGQGIVFQFFEKCPRYFDRDSIERVDCSG